MKTKTMILGAVVSASGNSSQWKAALANFLIVLLVQAVFATRLIINQSRFPEPIEWAQIIINSLAITLIFYGYNKISTPKETS